MTKTSQTLMDLLKFLPNGHGRLIAPPITDAEAEKLFSLWMNAPPGTKTVMASEADVALKSLLRKGYLTQSGSGFEITEKGRKVIVEMVTSMPNALDKKAKMPSYREIKSKTARSRPTFITKKASKEPSEPYNYQKMVLDKRNADKNNK